MNQHINITLRLPEGDVDVRIPQRIEVRRLIREIDAIFHPGVERRKYQLRVINKGLILSEGKYLYDTFLASGDIVEIEES